MTTVYAYDAMGVGLSTKSGTFVSSGTTDIVTYTDSVWYDYDTIEVYEEYNYGQYYVYSYVDFVGGTTYAVQDMYAYDQFNNDLLDVIGLNLQFNILDDFSGDILFSNIWSGNDHMTGNNYGDAIYLGAGQDTGIGRGGNDRIYGESGNDYLRRCPQRLPSRRYWQ
jgi:Ca2+-binding RTX toxin-like protein